jgi:putative ABC transport system permease protein
MSKHERFHAMRVFGAGLRENVRMALDTLRANKGRSGLVILGVGIGVTTLMAMVSIIEGFKGRLESEIMETETTYVYVTSQGTFDDPNDGENPNLTLDDLASIEALCPSVRTASPIGAFGTLVRHGSERANLMEIDGVGVRALEIMGFTLEEGRWLNETDWSGSRSVCCIPREPADQLFGSMDPIGKKIRVNMNTEFTVIGILENRESIFGSMANNYVLVPYTTLIKHFPWTEPATSIMAMPDGNDLLEAAREEIELALRIGRKLGPGEENNFHIATQDMMLDFTKQITDPLTLVGVVLASIGLMVGGIGVVTIMLVSVKERTREIGIRKAVGGRRQDILMQFLVEAATLTGLGGAAGILAGLLIGQILRLAFHVPATVPIPYVLGALAVSSFTGIFFGLYPAIQASKLNPVDSLSYE